MGGSDFYAASKLNVRNISVVITKAALFTGAIFQGETWHALINTAKFMHKRAQSPSVRRIEKLRYPQLSLRLL